MVVANAVVNRAGISFLSRLADETGAALPILARAHIAARDVFDVSSTWTATDDLDLLVPAATQDRMFLAARRLVERGARWLVRHSVILDLEPTVARFREPVAEVVGRLTELAVGADATAIAAEAEQLRADGVPTELANRVATFPAAIGALVIADIAAGRGAEVDVVASVFFVVADRLRIDWLRDRIAALPRADRWQIEARAALRDDVADLQRVLTEGVLETTDAAVAPSARVDEWIAEHADCRGALPLGAVRDRGGRCVRLGHPGRGTPRAPRAVRAVRRYRFRLNARRTRSANSAARAAFAPHAPWTPPPG